MEQGPVNTINLDTVPQDTSEPVACPRCGGGNQAGAYQCSSCFAPLQVSPTHAFGSGAVYVDPNAMIQPAPYGGPVAPVVPMVTPMPAPVPPPMYISDLPPGWERRFDGWGREYFVDHTTHRTQWEHPGAPPQHHILPAFIRQLSEPRYQGPDDGKQGTKGDEKDNADDKKYIPGSDQHLQRVVMDAGSPGCFAVIGDTLYYNKCLTCMTVFMWTFGIAAAVCGVKGYGSFKGLFITALVFYGIYFISFICLAGVICYCQCCMGGPAVGDYIHDYMYEEPSKTDAVLKATKALYDAPPTLTAYVECSHQKSSGSGKNRKTQTVVTFRGQISMRILNHRDVSVTPEAFVDSVDYCKSNHCSVQYHTEYRLSESQEEYFKKFLSDYYEKNKHRDTSCSVTHKYEVSADHKTNISVVLKNPNATDCRYRCSQVFINNPCLWLAMYASLYLPYICCWKRLVRPFRYHNIKFLVLDETLQAH